MKKIKEISTLIIFIGLIFGFGIWHLCETDNQFSTSERRLLQEAPEFSSEGLLAGDFSSDFESYLLDQFPLRDKFRSLKAFIKLDILREKDNNQLYLIGDGIYKWENKLDEKQINYFTNKVNSISEKYLSNCKVYYSIIPDKNYFVAEKNGYPSLDYTKLISLVNNGIKDAEYINIYNSLSIDDYYLTDTHWKQEKLEMVVKTLGEKMGFSNSLPSFSTYKKSELSPFNGVYASQLSLKVKTDTITYLENNATKNALVTGAEFQGKRPVYTLDQFTSEDSYNIFLDGAKAILEIENPKAKSDKELIIFRDSFASSLTPLLLDAYKKITLIDLRYLSSEYIGDFVDFDGEDVLFLYSTSLVNSGMLLK